MIKLLKGNMLFQDDPKVLEFIEYMKEKHSQDIRSIKLDLYDEDDAVGNEWMATIRETSDNKEQGHVWVPWHIPTTQATISEGSMAPTKGIDSKYSIKK